MIATILLVDDDIQVLKALKRAFLETEYTLLTAESAPEALELLLKEQADMIISDMRMPMMDGYQLLNKIKEKYPGMIRIILSGYSDEAVVYKAIQGNVAKHYVFKPWENKKLVDLVDQIFETEQLLEKDNLLDIINSAGSLPTLKSSHREILDSIDHEMEIRDIIRLIERDQSIATRMLQVANSAFFGVRTGSIRQAVMYLGLLNVRNLIISTSILELFNSRKSRDRIAEGLWEHAFKTSRILTLMYEEFLGKRLPEIAMSAGLLHNIGHVLLYNKFQGPYLACLNKVKKENLNILDAEQEAFGANHQRVGGYLLKWWDLPFPIVEAALYHHDPLNPNISNSELLGMVNLAQGYAWKMLNHPVEGALFEELLPRFGIDRNELEARLNRAILNRQMN